MKYVVILAFETYRVGDVIEPSGLWADSLKSRGYIEPIVEEKPKAKVGRPKKSDPRGDVFSKGAYC